jgi:hypothetical protein
LFFVSHFFLLFELLSVFFLTISYSRVVAIQTHPFFFSKKKHVVLVSYSNEKLVAILPASQPSLLKKVLCQEQKDSEAIVGDIYSFPSLVLIYEPLLIFIVSHAALAIPIPFVRLLFYFFRKFHSSDVP